VVVWLGNAKAKVRVVGGWPADIWDPWCRGVARVVAVDGQFGCVAEVVVVDGEFGCVVEVMVVDVNLVVWRRWWRRVRVRLMLHLVERRFSPLLLLEKNVDGVL
jgi:hypothetical protein